MRSFFSLSLVILATLAAAPAKADGVSLQDPACHPNCYPTPDSGSDSDDAVQRALEMQQRMQDIINQNNQNFEELQDTVREMLEVQQTEEDEDDEPPSYSDDDAGEDNYAQPITPPALVIQPSAPSASSKDASKGDGDIVDYLELAGRFRYPGDSGYRDFEQSVSINGRMMTIQDVGGGDRGSDDHTHRWVLNLDDIDWSDPTINSSSLDGIIDAYELDFYYSLATGSVEDEYYIWDGKAARARIFFRTKEEAVKYYEALKAFSTGEQIAAKSPSTKSTAPQPAGEPSAANQQSALQPEADKPESGKQAATTPEKPTSQVPSVDATSGDVASWLTDMFHGDGDTKVIHLWNRSKKTTYKVNQILIYDCQNVFIANCGVIVTNFFLAPEARTVHLVTKGMENTPLSFKYSFTYEDSNPKAKGTALNGSGSSDNVASTIGMTSSHAPPTTAPAAPQPEQSPAKQETLMLMGGARYDGTTQNGVPSGPGKLTGADGSVTQATFVNGLANGVGTWANPKGHRFEGKFVDGRFSSGLHRWSDGSTYDGEFLGGKITGKGTRITADGIKETGQFLDGKLNGSGDRTLRGKTISGTWNGGAPAGVMTITELDGFSYSVRMAGDQYQLREIGKIVEVFTNYGYLTASAEGAGSGTTLFAKTKLGEIIALKLEKSSGAMISATPHGSIVELHAGMPIYVSQ